MAQSNQKTIKVLKIEVIKTKILKINPFVNLSDYKVIKEPKYILKAETETTIKPKLIMGIKTLLDIMSITLQDRRERNQKGLSK